MIVSHQASCRALKPMIMMLAVTLCNVEVPPMRAIAQAAGSPYPGGTTVIQLPRSSGGLTHRPAASDLLQRMRHSLMSKGSAHIESSFRFVIPHNAQTIETY